MYVLVAVFHLAWQERKDLLGLPPLDQAPPKPAWPSQVVQPRNLQPWPLTQAQSTHASATVLVQAQPQTGVPKPPLTQLHVMSEILPRDCIVIFSLRPSGPPPAKLQEPPGPPTEPQKGSVRGLSATAPAFQPGHAWHKAPPAQCPETTYPFPEHGDQHCHQVPVERGTIMSMPPSVQAHPLILPHTPLPANQWPSQSSNLGSRPAFSQAHPSHAAKDYHPARAHMGPGTSSMSADSYQPIPQQVALHGGPAPAQRRQYEERPAPRHHPARNSRCPQEAETGHLDDSWGQQEWRGQDWEAEWWRQGWRGAWSDWAASLSQDQGSKGGWSSWQA